ncbi:MAG: caspase family protein [Synechococcales bacterium]|nr:caspase family protein [Synechococcales bacterium]
MSLPGLSICLLYPGDVSTKRLYPIYPICPMPRAISATTARTSLTQGTIAAAKLWVLMIGVNDYQDEGLANLQYPALDCASLSHTLQESVQAALGIFSQSQFYIYHDRVSEDLLNSVTVDLPTLDRIRNVLTDWLQTTQPQDTVLFYFSGHGVLDESSQQVFLCCPETQLSQLTTTGLAILEVLQQLTACQAHRQIVWLDACHSGGMSLRTMHQNPSEQLVQVMQRQAQQSQGFYALLSCDRTQQSWEFPELGHGVFSYFLMRGLRGEAANAQGEIDADGLYKYVYHQTLRYVDQTNQQLRLINQQKRSRGDGGLQPEYPLQTPKRIVEGVGEFILGKRILLPAKQMLSQVSPRQAIILDGLSLAASSDRTLSLELSKTLSQQGQFQVEYFPKPGQDWSQVRSTIAALLNLEVSDPTQVTTILLYLRGKLVITDTGEPALMLDQELSIGRDWLRQQLRHAIAQQQIIILDCPDSPLIQDWVEVLQLDRDRSQCILAATHFNAPTPVFSQALVQTLQEADPQKGLSAAGWITKLQLAIAGVTPLHLWLAGARGVIEIIPEQVHLSDPRQGIDLGICPYMGLQAFRESDAPYFFGRDRLLEELLGLLEKQSVLAVVGASGSGKSSLVQAGLMAKLRQGDYLPGSEQWWIGRMRPSDRPITALAQVFSQGSDRTLEQLEGFLHQGIEGFVYELRSRSQPVVLLIIDQFEELFTLAPDEDRRRFLDLILGALEFAGDRFKVVLTLRVDFMAPCLEIPQLAEVVQRSSLLVPACLNEADYRSVILKPAEQVGLQIEPELVEVLLQELDRTTGDLPILQFVLEQLWHCRQQGILTLQSYQKEIGGLRGVLEAKAQEAYDSLDPEAQACARWIFLNLTQLGDNTEDTRRRIARSQLNITKFSPELVDRTLASLTMAKLIVIDTDRLTDDSLDRSIVSTIDEKNNHHALLSPTANPETAIAAPTIEVTHEILIRHWSTLRWWLDENRSRLKLQRQIEQAAQQWNEQDRKPEFLLRGVRLVEAEQLYIDYTDELTQITQEFIEAAIAENQREILTTQRRLRKAQAAIAIISSLGIGATALAGIALYQQRSAKLQEIDALTASSEALLTSQQQLESLTAALQAGELSQALDRSWWQFPAQPEALHYKTISTLQQVIDRTQEINRLEGHSNRLTDVAVGLKGDVIATASDDKTIKLWQPNGKWMSDLVGHQNYVTRVIFSPNGEQIATASADRTIKLWTLTGQLLQTFTSHQDWVTDLQFTRDGQELWSTSRDRTIKRWRLSDGQLLQTITASGTASGTVSGKWVNTLAILQTDDRTLLFSGDETGAISLWDGKGKLLRKWQAHPERVTQLRLSPDRTVLLSAGGDRTLKQWSTSGKLLQTHEQESDRASDQTNDQINGIDWNSTGTAFAAAFSNGTIQVWKHDQTATWQLLGHRGEVTQVSWLNDRQLVSAGADKTARLWQLPSRFSPADHQPSHPLRSLVKWSRDGNWLVAAQTDHQGQKAQHSILLWSVKSGQPMGQPIAFSTHHSATILAIDFHPDNQHLVSADAAGVVNYWTLQGQRIRQLAHTSNRVNSALIAADGKSVAIAGENCQVQWLELPTGRVLQQSPIQKQELSAIASDITGKQWVTAGYDRQVKRWDAAQKKFVSLGQHNLQVASLAFTSDGRSLASGSWDNTIRLWSLASPVPPQILTGHNNGVTQLSFSPSGNTLISSSADGTIKLWDIPQQRLIKTIPLSEDPVLSMSLSPDGKHLVTSSESAGMHISHWNLQVLLQQGCDRINDYRNIQNHARSHSKMQICSPH